MSLYRFLYFLLFGALLWLGGSSFQNPDATANLLSCWETARQHHQTDSLLYYQAVLSEAWTSNNQPDRLSTHNRQFLDYVIGNQRFSAAQQRQLLDAYPPYAAWYYAYQTQWHWAQGASDSAYYYLSLLKAQDKAESALVVTYGVLARALAQEGNLRDAATYLTQAETMVQNPDDALALYPHQVVVYAALGQTDLALNKAVANIKALLQRERVDSIALAYAYDRLTQRYLADKRYHLAAVSGGEALNYIADRAGHDHALSQFWYRMAKANYHLGNKPIETLLYLRRVFSLLEPHPNTPRRQRALIDAYLLTAAQFAQAEQLDSAQRYSDLTQQLQRTTPYRLGDGKATQARIYRALDQPILALQALEGALDATRATYGPKGVRTAQRWLAIGQHHQRQRRPSMAKQAFLRGLWALSYRPYRAQALPPMATVYASEQALALGTARMESLLAQYQQSRYAVSLETLGVQQAYNEALLDRLGQASRWTPLWLRASRRVGEQAVDWCWQGQENGTMTTSLPTALLRSEEARQAQFKSDVQGEKGWFWGVDSSLQADIKLQEQRLVWYQRLIWESTLSGNNDQLDWYQKQLASATARRNLALKALKERYPNYYHWYYARTPITVSQLKQQLRNDQAALLQYLETPKALYQWVVTPDTLLLRRIVWEEYVPTVLKYGRHFTNSHLRRNTRSGGFQDYCRTAHELYYRLVHHEVLKPVNRWVVVPDGWLQTIPFETLLTDIPLDSIHEAKYGQLAYLLRKRTLSYQYSHQQWWATQRDTLSPLNHELLAFGTSYRRSSDDGNALYQTWYNHIQPQWRATMLMDSLTAYYAGDYYTNRYATEHYLKKYAGDYGIQHWGWYGMAPKNSPHGTGVLMAAKGDEEDHILWLSELQQLPLNADLVVLTNWWTDQQGRVARSSWTQLGGSITYAGSRALLMPLWEQDSSSVLVLEAYYKNLSRGQAKDEALRQAKLLYLQSAKGTATHPARWAGYIPLGNYQVIEVGVPVAYTWWFVLPIAFVGFFGWWSLRALRQRR